MPRVKSIRDITWTKGHVYVIGGYRNGILKVGTSKFPADRVYGLKSTEQEKLGLLYVTPELPNARAVERATHKLLARWSLGNELFEIDLSTAIYAIQLAIKGIEAGVKIPPVKRYKPYKRKARVWRT